MSLRQPSAIWVIENEEGDAEMAAYVLQRTAPGSGFRLIQSEADVDAAWHRVVLNLDAPPALLLVNPAHGGALLMQSVRDSGETHGVKAIPSVLMTDWDGDRAGYLAARLGAASLMEKARDPRDYRRQLCQMADYWLRLNRLPTSARSA